MSRGVPEESRLVEAVHGLDAAPADLAESMALLEGWMSGLTRLLADRRRARPRGGVDSHAIAREARSLDDLLAASAEAWDRERRLLAPAHAVADLFADRVMLLVFGKFNAGKSSLCNALADRFAAQGRAAQCFRLEEGRVIPTAQPLWEGATETTSTLQGVCLGDGLVLLDTPGLHSTTPANTALTRRFTDSADALLWLTSATSPGQVQELDELARELHRHKPLLPVITRSDAVEEDEVDGEIVQRLRNKTPANRSLQEDDVQERARGKLLRMGVPPSLLRPPVSVSTRMAREGDFTADALQESGLDRLCGAILALVEPALAYKRRKPVEVLLHHLEETVAGGIESRIEPALSLQASHLALERERLHALQARLVILVWRQVASEVPAVIESCPTVSDARRRLADLLRDRLAREVASELDDHEITVSDDGVDLGAMEPVDDERLHGALQRALHRQIVIRLDAIFAPLRRSLDEIEHANGALRASLARHVASLLALKPRLRGNDD